MNKVTNLNEYAQTTLKLSLSEELVIRTNGSSWEIYADGGRLLGSGNFLTPAFVSAIEALKTQKTQKTTLVKPAAVITTSLSAVPKFTVYCDGSANNNGKANSSAAGCAVVIEGSTGVEKIFAEYIGEGTNNQAEIVGACIGLENIKVPSEIEVFADSDYVIKTMQGKFRKLKNVEFWARLQKACDFHKSVNWNWVKGHSGNYYNELCDIGASHANNYKTNNVPEHIMNKIKQSK